MLYISTCYKSWFEVSFLVLLDEFIQNIPHISPATLRHQNGVPVVPSHLRYGEISALVVALHVEVEAFVFYLDVLALTLILRGRGVSTFVCRAVIESLNQLSDVLFELPHTVGRDEHVEPGVGVGLGDLQKPPPCVLLQVHVVLLVIFVHHLSLQLALLQIVGVNLAQAAVELHELGEVLVELTGSGESHHYLVLSTVGRHLGDFDEPSSLVLLHVEVEPLPLQGDSPGGQVPLTLAPSIHLIIRVRHLSILNSSRPRTQHNSQP